MNIAIVRPRSDAPEDIKGQFARINPGSVCCLIQRHDTYFIYYEGGFYSRQPNVEPTPDEREEYAKIAAGRAKDRAPTVAFFALPQGGEKFVEAVGFVKTDLPRWGVFFFPEAVEHCGQGYCNFCNSAAGAFADQFGIVHYPVWRQAAPPAERPMRFHTVQR